MYLITSIRSQKNGRRVNVYLDDRFGFGVDLDNFVKLNLKVGQELTDEEIEEIIKKAEFQKILDKLLKFATLRPRSEKEVRDYFKIKKVHESLHKDLFNRLKRLDLVDDEKFAKWWVEQRLEFKFKSKRELEFELRQKGIGKETIGKVLGESDVDEEKTARKLLEKKANKWKDLASREARQKTYQYLAGKGFGWEVIEKVIGR